MQAYSNSYSSMPAEDYQLSFGEAREVLARRLSEPAPGRKPYLRRWFSDGATGRARRHDGKAPQGGECHPDPPSR